MFVLRVREEYVGYWRGGGRGSLSCPSFWNVELEKPGGLRCGPRKPKEGPSKMSRVSELEQT